MGGAEAGMGWGGRQGTHPYLASANPTGSGDSWPMRGCSLHSYRCNFGSEHRNHLDEYASGIRPQVYLSTFISSFLFFSISLLSPSLFHLPHSSSLLHFFSPFSPFPSSLPLQIIDFQSGKMPQVSTNPASPINLLLVV